MKSVSHIILAAMFATGTAIAQDRVDFDEHDQDGDGYLSQEEWEQVDNIAIDFETADIDRDGRLDRAEVEQAEQQSAMLVGSEEQDVFADEERVAHDEGSDLDYQAEDEATAEPIAMEDDPLMGDDTLSESDDAASFEQSAEQDEFMQAGVEDEGAQAADQDAMTESGTEEVASFEQTAEQDEFMQAGAEDDAAMESASEEPVQESDIGYASSEVELDESRSESADVEFVSDEEPADDSMQAATDPDFPEDEGQRAFADADADGDGRISEDEARMAGFEYVAIYFDELDADGDGYLDESEWDLSQSDREPRNVSLEGDSEDVTFDQAGFEETEDEEDDVLMDDEFED